MKKRKGGLTPTGLRAGSVDRKAITLPDRVLQKYSGKYPGIWKLADIVRRNPDSAYMQPWQPWCYLPVNAMGCCMMTMLRDEFTREEFELCCAGEQRLMTALAAWRMTKGVYAFDPDTLQAIFDSNVADDVPVEVLTRLPEWCVYVPTPGLVLHPGLAIHGFFAHMDDHVAHGHQLAPELNFELMLDPSRSEQGAATALASRSADVMTEVVQEMRKRGAMSNEEGAELWLQVLSRHESIHMHMSVELGAGSVRESLRLGLTKRHEAAERTREALQAQDGAMDARKAIARMPEEAPPQHEVEIAIDGMSELIMRLMNVVLYLCSDEPEVAQQGLGNAKVAVQVAERKGKVHPAAGVRQFDVGLRLGAALRQAKESAAENNGAEVHLGGTVRPHIRRAHFHTFLRGPRSGAQTKHVKWLPPIAVMVKDSSELPCTVRPANDSGPLRATLRAATSTRAAA